MRLLKEDLLLQLLFIWSLDALYKFFFKLFISAVCTFLVPWVYRNICSILVHFDGDLTNSGVSAYFLLWSDHAMNWKIKSNHIVYINCMHQLYTSIVCINCTHQLNAVGFIVAIPDKLNIQCITLVHQKSDYFENLWSACAGKSTFWKLEEAMAPFPNYLVGLCGGVPWLHLQMCNYAIMFITWISG